MKIKIIKKGNEFYKWWNEFIDYTFDVYETDDAYYLTDESLEELSKINSMKVIEAMIYKDCCEIIVEKKCDSCGDIITGDTIYQWTGYEGKYCSKSCASDGCPCGILESYNMESFIKNER